jgi:hypothetical protein
VRAIKILICFVLTLIGVSTANAQWPSTTSTSNGRFWMETGASIFDRPGSDLGLPLVSNSITNDVFIDSNSATDLNSAFGPNIKIGSTTRMGFDWEAGISYANWAIEQEAEGPDLVSPFFPPALDPDVVGVAYDSEFFDLQLNARKAVFPGMTFLAGPRFLNLNDEMVLTSSTNFSVPFVGDVLFETQNDIITRNRAYGGSIGFEYNQPVTRDFYLQGSVKASGLLNQSSLERRSITTTDALLVEVTDKNSGMFIGQAGGRAYFEFIPRTVAGYLGYEATWVDGVASAPSQALTVGSTDLKTSNTIFWHSYSFGMKFTY